MKAYRGFESHPVRHAPPEQFSDLTPAPQGPGTSGLFAAKLPYSPRFRAWESRPSATVGGPVSARTHPHRGGDLRRAARLIEFDPHYCDVIIRRFERLTGKQAVLQEGGALFDDVALGRLGGLAA